TNGRTNLGVHRWPLSSWNGPPEKLTPVFCMNLWNWSIRSSYLVRYSQYTENWPPAAPSSDNSPVFWTKPMMNFQILLGKYGCLRGFGCQPFVPSASAAAEVSFVVF